MKSWTVVITSLSFAIITTYGICFIGDKLIGDASAIFVLPLALVIGINSRKIVEKITGYKVGDE